MVRRSILRPPEEDRGTLHAVRRAVLVVAVIALVVAVAGMLLVRDARAATDHMADVRTELLAARAAYADGEVDDGRAAVERARSSVSAASGRVNGPLWTVARSLPRVGVSADAAQAAVSLGEAAVDLAAAVGDEAADLLAEGAGAFVDSDGRIRTGDLADLSVRLDGLPVEPLVAARDRLAALPAAGLIGPARQGRDDAVAVADDAIETVTRAQDAVRSLGGFLGADGPRRYLLAVQNPGELRGTGGLMSYLAEFTIVDGDMSVRGAGVEVGDDLEDRLGRPGTTENTTAFLDPVERSAEFAARYDHNAGGGLLQSVNLDPDLPTVGPVLVRLYAARGGSDVDGVILVDPVALARILDATGGPMEVPPEFLEEAPGLPAQLTADNLAQTLLVTVYDTFGGLNPLRRAFDETITLRVFDRLTSGGWDPVELGHALGDAAGERHLQLFSLDESEQAAFERLGIAGQVTPVDGTDVLAVTGINAGPDKSDVHVAHRMTGEVQLAARAGRSMRSVERRLSLEVAVDNPLVPGDRDTYIIGTDAPAPIGSGEVERTDDALNRTWFSVWAPPATQLGALRDAVSRRPFRFSNIHGHRAFDFFLETPSASTASFQLEVYGDVPLRVDGDELVYTLTLWRQAKAIPDHWDLTVRAPSGWEVSGASVAGGGEPVGMGVGGSGAVLSVEVADATARLVGAATRDAVLEIRLTQR